MTANTMLDASGGVRWKSCFLGFLAFGCLLTFAGALQAEDKKQPVIYWAGANYTNGSIMIKGDNLGKPVVELAGQAINVSSSNDHQIVAQMPAGIQPGTYLLKVTWGSGSKDTVSFYLTIGAVPVSSQGGQGPVGPTGPSGTAGQNAFMTVQTAGGMALTPNPNACDFSPVPGMSGTITVPTTPNGSFVYATAAGNFNVFSSGYTHVDLVIVVDGSPLTSTVSSPHTYTTAYTPSTPNQSIALSWTVNGLFTLAPGNHSISLYAANCGQTGVTLGLATGATLTGMVLNK